MAVAFCGALTKGYTLFDEEPTDCSFCMTSLLSKILIYAEAVRNVPLEQLEARVSELVNLYQDLNCVKASNLSSWFTLVIDI